MSFRVPELIHHVDKEAKQPSYIKKQLKPHQLMSIQKCLDIENGIQPQTTCDELIERYNSDISNLGAQLNLNTCFGAICDPVGSGKTLIVLSLIKAELYATKSFSSYVEFSGMVNIKLELSSGYQSEIIKKVKYSVIVVPHVIVTQWDKVIKNDTTLKHTVFQSLDKLNSELNSDSDIDIILVKNTKYREFYDSFGKDQHFKRVFYDEADSIRIPRCEKLKSLFYWFVTASSQSLMYCDVRCTGFFRTVFCADNRYILKYLMVKNNEKFIHESFNLEDYKSIDIQCAPNNIFTILSSHVSDNVQRMICAGDIEGAISTFDLQSTSENNIIKIVCEDLCIKLENKKNKLKYIHSKQFSTEKAKKSLFRKYKKR
jgi:DNA polymerase III delta prime subunit